MTDDDDKRIICPTCGNEITPEMALWTWMGRWYHSEQCVRAAQKSVWGERR